MTKPALLLLAALAAVNAADSDLVRAKRIHAQTVAVDSHIDTIQWALTEGVDLSKRLSSGHVDLPRLREAGVRAPFFALYAPTYYKGSEAVRRTLQLRDAMQKLLDAHPDEIELATSAADVERITASPRKIAAILTIEGGHQIADDLAVLRMYRKLGIVSITLSHFRNNNWADSSTDKPEHAGLTDFGKEVVREMNRLGMMVDISHVSDKTFYDALAVTTKPVIASHSSCRALSSLERNMTDDMIRALAKNGGVMGINFGAGFVNQKDADAQRKKIMMRGALEPNLTGKALDAYAAKDFFDNYAKMRPSVATLGDVVEHIDHVVKLVGVDHVGIGSDYDGISTVPVGLEDIAKLPALTAALLSKGYSEADVKKILGGNFLRVLRAVAGK